MRWRRTEAEVAADTVAAIFCSGLVARTEPCLASLAKHAGVDPADARSAVARHLDDRWFDPTTLPTLEGKTVTPAALVPPGMTPTGRRCPTCRAPVFRPLNQRGHPPTYCAECRHTEREEEAS